MPRHTPTDKYDILELARRIVTIINNSEGRVLSSMEIKKIGGLGRAIHRLAGSIARQELCRAAKVLREAGQTQNEIASTLKITQGYVSRLLRMGEEDRDHG